MPCFMACLGLLMRTRLPSMLTLPPPELAQRRAQDDSACVPPTRFFLVRVLAGAGLGAALLFLTCACTTYEVIAKSGEWSARLSMTAGGARHEGVRQMLLMTAKLMAMLLLAANMLCAAEQALVLAFPALRRRRAGLAILVLLLGLSLAVRVLQGDAPVLFSAPAIGAAALLLGIFAGRGRRI